MADETASIPTRRSPREVLETWVRILDAVKAVNVRRDATLPSLFNEMAEIHGDSVALIGPHESLGYRALAERASRYARWAGAHGLGGGDVVCLMMPNCPDYVAIWTGVTQVGCTVALINTNCVGDALLHCIEQARPAHIIAAAVLLDAIMAIADRLPRSVHVWVHGEAAGPVPRVDLDILQYAVGPLDLAPSRRPLARDSALLIYTSGTTGLPKAANVSHGRLVEWSCWFAAMMDVQPADRLYNCLPMYHSIGGCVAIGAMLTRGGSVLLRERFSARRFWDDVVDGECTIFQYIGELCRYLLRTEPHPRETRHRLRLCCGNGLRGDVWPAFQRRFAIPHILEFYAATEGGVSLYNLDEMPGAIGRVPAFLAHRAPIALIRYDLDTEEPLRDLHGRCIPCATDEPGEAIGQILGDGAAPARQFDGYTDAAATARKILVDVFAAGDRWYRSGDLMRRDAAGYYYFVDRMGDTFRWKGENVATTEVAAVAMNCPGVNEAAVYGVEIPGTEGRAGMAAITTTPTFSLPVLHRHLAANLPAYARPVFVRRCDTLSVTGTFKFIKGKLAKDGYSKTASPDPIWFDDPTVGAYVECDDALRDRLSAGIIPYSRRPRS